MNIDCTKQIIGCVLGADDTPIANFSAEAADPFRYLGIGWSGPRNQAWNDPTIDSGNYTSEGCIKRCVSTVSQAAADLCAAQQADDCYQNGGGSGGSFSNTQQFYTYTCGAGLGSYLHYVAAGLYSASSQAAADALAAAQAKQEMAQLTALCFLSSAAPDACYNEAYFHKMQVTGNDGSLVWSIVGILPPGMALTVSSTPQIATLTGTPTLTGTYNFTVRVARTNGDECVRSYSIRVGGHLSPTALPNGAEDDAYSYTLLTVGTGYIFSVTSGALPTGLTLSPNTGVISGTPTVAGTYTFTVGIER